MKCLLMLMTLVKLPYNGALHDTIVQESRTKNFNLVTAVVATESLFNPEATSHVGARGLMQVMPKTAAWLYKAHKKRCNLKEPNLYDPANNIAYGSCYLSVLDELYKGDLVKILLHYHSGGGGVKRLYRKRKMGPNARYYVTQVLKYYFYCHK